MVSIHRSATPKPKIVGNFHPFHSLGQLHSFAFNLQEQTSEQVAQPPTTTREAIALQRTCTAPIVNATWQVFR
jgi:hypothetical protein